MADSETPAQNAPGDGGSAPAAIVKYWLDQLGSYDEVFKSWESRCKKIIRRYRDERDDDAELRRSRFNALWANVQTLGPAVYARAPKPVVERRYLDKDTLGRFASMTLERAVEVQIEIGGLHEGMKKAALDYLLCGRGTIWERYEPVYQGDEVSYEKVTTDYVAYNNFKHAPAPVWEEVWWVAKKELLTRRELRDRFDAVDEETGKPIADLVPLQNAKADADEKERKRLQPRACVWEIWDKVKRQVVFICPDWPSAPLEVTDDPLQLESFWPCPKPLYATITNDTLVPVPDFAEYQDQADELDDITRRISALTDAIRVNGIYDASYPELQRILSEGVDNRMIGVKNYAEFASKGGLKGAMDFVPIKDVVDALVRLYEARDRVKADMAEITGLSDIVRGQAQGAAKTATEQRIKGQFASLRLEDRKKEVARFARDAIRIAAEIIAEQFSPQVLAEMTGIMPVIAEEFEQAAPGVSPPPGNGAPGGGTPPVAGQQPPDPMQQAQQVFAQACELLRSDKMRTFRIDIETDSTIDIDKQEAKEAVVELFTAVGGFLEKALPIGQAMPSLAPALGQSILFAFRRFGAGRDVEGLWERAIDDLTKAAKSPQPKPPSPEEVKAQAEMQKAQMESERQQQQAAIDQQQAQTDLQVSQQKAATDIEVGQQKLQLERERLQLEREKLDMQRQQMALTQQHDMQRAAIEADSMTRQAALDERADLRSHELAEAEAERAAQSGEQQFELSKKTAEFKARQAMKPNKDSQK